MFAKPGRGLYFPLVIIATFLTFVPLYPTNGYIVSLYSTVPLWGMLTILLYFLRDPERPLIPSQDLTSPADGYIVGINESDEKVSILIELHVSCVHVQRTPLAGKVTKVEKVQGEFRRVYFIRKKLVGESDAIQKNSRTIIELESPEVHRTRIELIAGALARRCIPYVKVGDQLAAGQRVSMILFGSLVRIEVYNLDYMPAVDIGDHVFGNRTIILKKREKLGLTPSQSK
ncbi:MAG: phosphatidylserine decarboxylase [Promethearchaeota archaeon CR_4]|nr:MAG: phosphatidylserine decarboxylase [Candidatus Lokiarchaeota archaeon CR_4]